MRAGDWFSYKTNNPCSQGERFFHQFTKPYDARYAECVTLKLKANGEADYVLHEDTMLVRVLRPCTEEELESITMALFEKELVL